MSTIRFGSVVIALCAVAPLGHARVVEKIAAVVNSDIILKSELDERIRPMIAQLEQQQSGGGTEAQKAQRMQELQRQGLEHLIGEQLIVQEARKLKITVSEDELERAITDVMTRNQLTKSQLEDALRQEGKSLSEYREKLLKPQLLRLKVLNVQVRSRVSVTDDELKAAYQKSLRDLGADVKVHARHIFIAIPQGADDALVAARRKVATELMVRIKNGEDFADLARAHSQDPATKDEGGDLGTFSRGTLPVYIEDVVFAMRPKELRGPLRAERGFHVIELLERQESSARSYTEVVEELRQQLYSQKLEKATDVWLKEVRKHSHVDIKL